MRAIAEPARSETVYVRNWRQARDVITAWREGDLGMSPMRGTDQMQRLFEATGLLRLRARRRVPVGCSEVQFELVVKRSQG